MKKTATTFQRLKDNDNTIQGKIEDVLTRMTEEKIEIIYEYER